MAKSKPKVKRGISKSKKPARPSLKAKKKPSKEVLPAIPKEKPPKEKELLPPPPPGYFKKKEFSPSLHDIGRIVSKLRKDIHYIMENEKVLFTPEERLMIMPDKSLLKILDLLKDEGRYVEELQDIEKKIHSYEELPKKGWLLGKRIREASTLLQAYKEGAAEKRDKIIRHLTSIRKQKEMIGRQRKQGEEQTKKEEIIKSLEEPKEEPKPPGKPKAKPAKKGFFIFKKKKVAKPKKEPKKKEKVKKPKAKKPKEEALPSVKRKHVFQLKESLEHITKSHGFFKKLDEKFHTFSHKELHAALDRLKRAREHLGRVEDIEEHVAAQASVPHGRLTKGKLDIAKKLIDKHKIDVRKTKSKIIEKVKSVKKRISTLEKEHKKAKEEKEKSAEEAAEFLPKLSELKKHLKYVAGNKKLLELPEDKLSKLSSSKLYDISNKLNILKQYIGEIEDIEEHLVAESSKPRALTAEKHLEDAKKLVDSYGVDIKKDRSIINKRIGLIKKLAKEAEKEPKKPEAAEEEAIPKPIKEKPEKPKPEKPEEMEKPPKPEKLEKVKPVVELEVPKPRFERPDPEFVKLTYQLKKNLKFALKNEGLLQISDDVLRSYSSRKVNKITKKLNILKQCLDDAEHAEEHIAAESSMPKGLTAEKQLEDAKKLIDSYGIDVAKKLKDVDVKLKFIDEIKQPEKPPEAIEKPEIEEKEEEPELKPEKIEPEIPKLEEVKEEEEIKPEAPPPPKFEVPSKELAMRIYRLKRALDYVAKNEKPLQISDDVLRSLSSWRLRWVAKRLIILEQRLDDIEGIEEHIAAESSVPKGAAIEGQLEKARDIMDSFGINVAKKLKEVKAKINFLGNLKPGLIPVEEVKVEKPVKEEKPLKEKVPKEIPKPELELPKIGKLKPELAKLTAELKKNLNLVTKNENILQIPDDALSSLSSWKSGRVAKKLNLMKQALDRIEDIEEHIAAESSVSPGPAVEAQLENAKKIMESYGIDPAKKLKVVSSKLDLMPERIKPPEKVPELKAEKPEAIETPQMDIPPPPEKKEAEEPKISKKKELPPPVEKPAEKPVKELEVPEFKPSPAELYMLISRLKKDLNFIANHERFLHTPDEKVVALSHRKFDNIFEQLKTEEKYLNDLEEIEKKINRYEEIPDKGWLSAKKIDEARRLLEAYKSTNVSMTRKMLMSRLELMKDRKGELEGEVVEKKKGITEAIAEREAKLGEEAKVLKEVETHAKKHEKTTAEELAADLKSLKLAKGVGKPVEAPRHKVIKFKPPKLEKPILEKGEFEARKEITEAIGAIKTGKLVTGDKIEYIMAQIDAARKALEDLDVETAKSIYVDIHTAYLGMKPLEQYKVYEALKDLYEDRKQAEKLVS